MTEVVRPAMPAAVAEAPVRTAADVPVWRRTVVGWHVAFWAVLAISALACLLQEVPERSRWTQLALLGAVGLAYALLGQPAATSRDALRRNGYRLVLVVVLGLLAAGSPDLMLLLYVAYPQVWLLSERIKDGVLFSVLLTCSVALGIVAHGGWSTSALKDAAPVVVVSLAVSLVLGIWIAKVVDQSEERGELITELQATREQLAVAHHASGVVAERERMAREIHDTLAQGFTSIVMLAATAAAELARERPDRAAGQLTLIEQTARDNLAEARALVAAFSPAALDDTTLPDAIRRLADQVTTETGAQVLVTFEPDDASVALLHPAQQVVLLRAAQEALTNVRKHARAGRVQVVLRVDPDVARIEVRDDGIGFAPAGRSAPGTASGGGPSASAPPAGAAAAKPAGFGLAGMRGRVEAAGGSLRVTSQPGRGTYLEVRVPVGRTDTTPGTATTTSSSRPVTSTATPPGEAASVAAGRSER